MTERTKNTITAVSVTVVCIIVAWAHCTNTTQAARKVTTFDADTYWQYQTVVKLADIPEGSVPFPLKGGDPETLVVMNVHAIELADGWAVRMSYSRVEPDGWGAE
ncbi:hypothetical protein LCGC14_2813400 [marine sediment metagenome]|uniref:Uncharacterized protein n=1 Tax=marine sediment metagenome TaxID=412755 RepID=A0A0F8YJ86_9ZZZZ